MLAFIHSLTQQTVFTMSENNYLSPVFVNDINERLEKNFSDEEVRKQNFNTIQNIAKNLNIGKKFKVPQAELLYLLARKIRWNCTA